MALYFQSQSMAVRFLLSASMMVIMQIAGAVGSHIFHPLSFHSIPQSITRQKPFPVMTRLWSPWASLLLFLDRGIELALFLEIHNHQARNRDPYQSTRSYLDIYPLPAGILVFVMLVMLDRALYKILTKIVPELKTDDSHAARMLGIDFMAPRLAFFVVLWACRQAQETMCISSTFVGSIVVWLVVRSWYAEMEVLERAEK